MNETDRLMFNQSLCNTLAPQQPPSHMWLCFALQHFFIHEFSQQINPLEVINLHASLYNNTHALETRGHSDTMDKIQN